MMGSFFDAEQDEIFYNFTCLSCNGDDIFFFKYDVDLEMITISP